MERGVPEPSQISLNLYEPILTTARQGHYVDNFYNIIHGKNFVQNIYININLSSCFYCLEGVEIMTK